MRFGWAFSAGKERPISSLYSLGPRPRRSVLKMSLKLRGKCLCHREFRPYNDLLMASDGLPLKPADHDSGQETQIYTYFGAVTLLLYLATPSGFLVDIATSYMLKNQLHASAEAVAQFRFLTAIPMFIAFVFGLIRDRWSPFGLRDRGYFLLFAPVTAGVFVWLAFGKLEFSTLFVGVFASMIAFRFVGAAYQGLISLIGQEKLMSGRLSTLWNVAAMIPVMLSAWGAGWVTEHLPPRDIFLVLAGLCLMVGALGLWKPKAVFNHAYDQPAAQKSHFLQDVQRLLRHRAIYPVVLICFLWNFAPGSATPLQYYLTSQLHLPDSVYANYNAIFSASFLPTFFLYGWLCKRVPLKNLLWWGTLIGVPQLIPLLFVHSAWAAQLLAVPIGMMGGVATAAYMDLAIRSCPPGLQGTLMMMVDGVFALSARGGDILGTKIYDLGHERGFLLCVVATTVVYACILPLILWVPKDLTSKRDGEENPDQLREVLQVVASNA